MNVKVKAQVVEVALKSEYATRDNIHYDYDRKIPYYESTLQLLDNPDGVRGSLMLREKLEIAAIHEISVNTDAQAQMVEIQELAASRLNED